MKRCNRCSEVKSLADFHRCRKRRYQAWCKSCRKSYDAAYHQRNRERLMAQKRKWQADFKAWYVSLKEGQPCADCGGIFQPIAMQWDHMPGESKYDCLGNLGRRHNKQRVVEEIAKCELVCANCHAVRTLARNGA